MGLTTIPEFLEHRFSGLTQTILATLLIISFVTTLLPIVLYTGPINIEAIFNISGLLGATRTEALWITVVAIGVVGSVYAIFGGLKIVAYTHTLNGDGLLAAGLIVPVMPFFSIGEGSLFAGLEVVFAKMHRRNSTSSAPRIPFCPSQCCLQV